MSKRLGQHFLINPSAVKTIVAALAAKPGETIIEIGPGPGVLTREIYRATEKNENKIIAIEKDAHFVTHLLSEFAKKPRITILPGDVRTDLTNIIESLGSQPYRLIGNLPYYLTGYLFRIISELPRLPKQCVFMVQREVADRIVAHPPQMNRLAMSIQIWAEPKIILNLKPENFEPRPKVFSSVLTLVNRPQIVNAERYEQLISILFAQPRKTISNNLCGKQKNQREKIENILKELNISPAARPQNLELEQIISITNSNLEI